MLVNHNAYFDALAIGTKLQSSLGDVASLELHLFSYLSCLLSLYKGHPVGSWGYLFAVTEQGYPYSAELDDSLKTLCNIGLIEVAESTSAEYLRITAHGAREYSSLLGLSQLSEREPFVEGACSSLLAMPVGNIRNALSNDLGIRGAITLRQSRLLLSESDMSVLYEQFSVLSEGIGVEVQDLMIPSIVWLTYLTELSER